MSGPLYRSRHDRMIAGVAGGLAERLGVDTAIVRIAWAILVLPTGFLAALAYVVMALVVPDEDEVRREPSTGTTGRPWPSSPPFPTPPWPGQLSPGQPAVGQPAVGQQAFGPDQQSVLPPDQRAERPSRRPGGASFIVGGSLVVLGSWFLMREYMPALDMSRFWPVAVVGFGILLVLLALGQRSEDGGGDRG